MSEPVAVPAANAEPGILADLLDLTKARLNMLVLITTFVGYWMGATGAIDWLRLIQAMLGTALCAASAAALNQLWEVKIDALMPRTADRPIVAGRMKKSAAFWIALALAAIGGTWLWLAVNALSAILAVSTILIYVVLYTPLKRVSAWCTLVGAVSGAIPPVVGWAAANPHLSLGAWVLFGVLFAWQMPHFLFTFLLTGITLVQFNAGLGGSIYLGGALLFNSIFFLAALHFCADRSRPVARRLFFTSIIYLPLILGLMVFTKV